MLVALVLGGSGIGFDLNAYLLDPVNLREGWPAHLLLSGHRQVKPLRCADGLELSVQASSTHYCEPRNGTGPWVTVEIGFPSQQVEEFMEYAENPDAPTDTVYARVPVSVVEAVIDSRGGIVPACAQSSP